MAGSGRGGGSKYRWGQLEKATQSQGKGAPRPGLRAGVPTRQSGERAPQRREEAAGSGSPDKGAPGSRHCRPGEVAMLPSQPGPRPRSCPRRGPGGQRGGDEGVPSARPSRGQEAPQETGPTPAGVPRTPVSAAAPRPPRARRAARPLSRAAPRRVPSPPLPSPPPSPPCPQRGAPLPSPGTAASQLLRPSAKMAAAASPT